MTEDTRKLRFGIHERRPKVSQEMLAGSGRPRKACGQCKAQKVSADCRMGQACPRFGDMKNGILISLRSVARGTDQYANVAHVSGIPAASRRLTTPELKGRACHRKQTADQRGLRLLISQVRLKTSYGSQWARNQLPYCRTAILWVFRRP